MKNANNKIRKWLLGVFLILAVCFPFFKGKAVQVSAASGDWIEIQKYDVDITVAENREIYYREWVTVKFLTDRATMFYKALPLEGDRYYDIEASCAGNEDFSFYVADNPDVDGFMDINCVGGVQKGAVWTYEISYTMELGANEKENGMLLDVVGYGTTVPLNDVSVTMHFPSEVQSVELYGDYGSDAPPSGVTYTLFEGRKTLKIEADYLPVVYNSVYGEYTAQGITVDFTLPAGSLKDFATTRIFTKDLWAILLGGAICIALAVTATIFTRKKRDIVTVVNIKAPDGMDPLKMGRWLDGAIDQEDITSMIYYFAHKGWLKINMEDEDDPVLLRVVQELPYGAKVYERTLFNGLFKTGDSVKVSELENHFYESADTARLQVPAPKMYDKKSVLGFFAGGIIGLLYAFLLPFLISVIKVGGDYTYPGGFILIVPNAVVLLLEYVRENYRYKWKKGAGIALRAVEWVIVGVFALIFTFAVATHLLTEFEKLIVCAASITSAYIGARALSRREDYCEELGQILGFKEFIVVTEEDKIKFMLEENPQLFYKVLPYAQVLGVTKEWEDKFANILIEPPAWGVASNDTLLDYMIINRCMRRASIRMMTRPAPSGGGGGIGRSGGGGSFGGFGGGGHGGGGFGAR